jgi:hypothetical protein
MGPRIVMAPAAGMTQQPTKSRPYHWGKFERGGAQGGDDWGGRGNTFSAIGLQPKKMMKRNPSWL